MFLILILGTTNTANDTHTAATCLQYMLELLL